jgi:DNA polymerase III alpha subunit
MTVRESIIKNGKSKGQKMLYLSVEDETGSIDSVIAFPNMVSGHEAILIEGNTVILGGTRDKKFTESFVINEIIQI